MLLLMLRGNQVGLLCISTSSIKENYEQSVHVRALGFADGRLIMKLDITSNKACISFFAVYYLLSIEFHPQIIPNKCYL